MTFMISVTLSLYLLTLLYGRIDDFRHTTNERSGKYEIGRNMKGIYQYNYIFDVKQLFYYSKCNRQEIQ